MSTIHRPRLERFAAALPGWIYLLSGLTLLSVMLVTPAWVACEQLGWQRDVMRLQADRLSGQRERFESFYRALDGDDPAVLERLAFTQLRYKPVGRHLWERPILDSVAAAEPNLADQPARADHPGAGPQASDQALAISGSIEAWLHEPMPVVGGSTGQFQSRLTRLATGPSRLALMAVAIAFLIGGLWSQPGIGRANESVPGCGSAVPS